MANKTITSSTDISSLIATGLLDGENIDINSGAVLTYDVSPTILIGQTKINDGKMLLDGANAANPIIFCGETSEEINANGAGVFETTLGWYVFSGTSNGLTGYTLDVSNYFSDDTNSNITSDIFAGIQVETGRRINYDGDTGVTPVVGDWLFKTLDQSVMGRISEVSVGYVVVEGLTGSLADNDAIELHTLQDNNGLDYQKSWNALANGADVLELDVWTWWGNTQQNTSDRMGLVGNGIDGRGFNQAHGSNTLTFGDGTNGCIPPAGCRFRKQMVHFCSATIANYSSGITSNAPGGGTPHNVECILGGDVILRGASLGTAVFSDAQAGSWISEFVDCQIATGSDVCSSRVIIRDTIVVSSFFGTAGSSRKYPFQTSDLVKGAEITDSVLYYLSPNSSEIGYLAAVTSKDISYTRCVQVTCTTNEEALFSKVDGITIYDCMYLGGDLDFTTSFNIDARLLKFQAVIGTAARNTNSMISFQASSNEAFIAGIEALNDSAYSGSIINAIDSSNMKVRGMHFIDDKLMRGAFGGAILRTTGLSTNIDISRVWVDEGNTDKVYSGTSTSADIVLNNVSSEYDGEIDAKGTNIRLNGVHSGSGNLGVTSGLETDYTSSFGSNAQCFMRTDTTGAISLSFMPDSDEFPFIDVTGNPKFTKDGDVDVVDGDGWTTETPIYYGITAFTGQYTSSRSSGSVSDGTDEIGSNVDCELQYDDGSGYNGNWLDCKVSGDMTGIPDLSAGAKFKIKISASGSRTNNNGILIHFSTTIAAQKANLYPIDQLEALLTVNVISDGAVNTQARVHVVADAGGALAEGVLIINASLVNGLGQSTGIVSSVPQPFKGLVVDALEPSLFVPQEITGTITSAGAAVTVNLISDE